MARWVVAKAFQFRGGMARPGACVELAEAEERDAFVLAHVAPAGGAEARGAGRDLFGYCGNGTDAAAGRRTGVYAAEGAAPEARKREEEEGRLIG